MLQVTFRTASPTSQSYSTFRKYYLPRRDILRDKIMSQNLIQIFPHVFQEEFHFNCSENGIPPRIHGENAAKYSRVSSNNKCMLTHRNIPSSEHEKIMDLVMDVVMHTQAHSVGRIRDGEFFADNLITGHTSTGICCSTQNAESFLLYQDKHTCSRVSCFEIVSFSIFLIFFMSLLTWNSCSCSKCCSNSAFSCWSWDGKGEGSAWREEKRRWMK